VIDKNIFRIDKVPDNIFLNLESRNVALWVRSVPKDRLDQEAFMSFLGLPWRLVFLETYDPTFLKLLEANARITNPMTRKRGYLQVIDSDPSRIELPQRCLPIYLLKGRTITPDLTDFENRLRRMTMLEGLRRSSPRDILVISGDEDPVPSDLKDLWSSGFRSYLTFVSSAANAESLLTDWFLKTEGNAWANLLRLPVRQLVDDVLSRYGAIYPEDRHVIRVRDRHGSLHRIDVTEVDEPERPILENYSLIEERDLMPITPDDLLEEDFVGFFRNPEDSWRPYAAGLPWVRGMEEKRNLKSLLKRLDASGSDEDSVAYIASESGAGGTTLARTLAWECASEGYPVLIAKELPFVPDSLPLVNFLNRAHKEAEGQMRRDDETGIGTEITASQDRKRVPTSHHYETPWLIVFDSLHWEYRVSDLARFRNEMEKSGRSVCVLVVMNTLPGLSFFSGAFKKIAELNHALDQEEARLLGSHLNRFLRIYGKERQDSQWTQFYENHTIRYLEGTAAFWVTLSFWIQGQYDLSESIQEWMFRKFKEHATDRTVRNAIIEIAAMSSERLPLPEVLLPVSTGEWPVSLLLEDRRSSLSALGLLRISANGEKHWALAHDILGRFLINAIFYDYPMREELGFAEAKTAEHLRFMLLRQISQKAALGERLYRSIGEDFATSIFKIDPDHGHGSFVSFWREVLQALDGMPGTLRDTSRVFRHHTAVSRRRVAKLDERYFGVTKSERIALLNGAIVDINYALTFIAYTPGSEPNVNLFNSLANAYLDLAEVESECGASPERVMELRQLANEATRKAYSENPTNSFVIETYVKNLLEDSSAQAIDHCIEALGIIFEALASNEGIYRKTQLGELADQALAILFKKTPKDTDGIKPLGAVDVLIKAWKVLAEGSAQESGLVLSDVPQATRIQALEVLADPAGRGNMQILRLRFNLTCIAHPNAFREQLDFIEQLQATDYRMTPQLRLEYAILLFQNGRAVEGDKVFRSLRVLWRESEQFVQVPARLRWLRVVNGDDLQTVLAITGSDYGTRAMARVQEFGDALVPFRTEEFGIRDLKPGTRFACHVSFGHNGPFLRPVTANAAKFD